MASMGCLARLTDASLHSELKRLVGCSNTLLAQLLTHLGEVEARGIHRERACSSLYTYCVYELRMSEDEAQRRCRAARLARQFPKLLEMLAEASLHLTGLLLIGPHLTEDNQNELLARARFRTKREIERLVAEIAPCPDVPSRIVPLHRAGAADPVVAPLEDVAPGLLARPRNSWAAFVRSLAGPVRAMEAGLAAGQAPPQFSDNAAFNEPSRADAVEMADVESSTRAATNSARLDESPGDTSTPAIDTGAVAGPPNMTVAASGGRADDVSTGKRTLAVDRRPDARSLPPAGHSKPTPAVPPVAEPCYRIQFTADQAYVDLLEEGRNLLQHELPGRDLVEVQRRALELLVRKLRQRKYASSGRPCRKGARPAHVARQSQPMPTPDRHEAAPPDANTVRNRPLARESARTAGHAADKSRAPGGNAETSSTTSDQRPAPGGNAETSSTTSDQRPAPGGSAETSSTGPRAHAAVGPMIGDRHAATLESHQGRYIPAEVRRRVWQRDEGRCTYVDTRGQRCREQSGLEFHHRHPHARRGPASVANLTLRCRSHNALAAEQDFGRDLIENKRRAGRRGSTRARAAT
jgi:5-methylcytosine-specific restriction endonuclease McrA